MCGIVGKVNLDGRPVSVNEIEGMRKTLVHRGPDDAGRTMFSLRTGQSFTPDLNQPDRQTDTFEAALGFNRLSIIDLSLNGRQPMYSLDGKKIIVFNGEIYNANEYRDELISRGQRFRGFSDTEVLLNLYECFGIDETLEKLNGMFAFCIVDLLDSKVYLCRDRLGIKPLYVYETEHTFMFSSEIKAFLASPDFDAVLNEEVVDEFTKFGYVTGAETLFKDVINVEPGELITFHAGKLKRRYYWVIPAPDIQSNTTLKLAEAKIEKALIKSLRYRLISDVEIGCQLSGGIDSSLISLLVTRYLTGESPVAVSVIHDNPKFSEESWIDQVASELDIRVEKLKLTTDDFISNLKTATWHRDLPLSSPSSVAIMLMSKLAKRFFTVFLSGEGADELFGGYERFFGGQFLTKPLNYHMLRLSPFANRILKSRYTAAHNDLFSLDDWFISQTSYIGYDMLRKLRPNLNVHRFMEKRRRIFQASDGDFISRAQYYDMKTCLVDLLLRQDTMTMAHSIENRLPFLDHNVVAQARRLPIHCLVGRDPRFMRSTKVVLKKLAAKYFGGRFAYRRKIGFTIPIGDYFHSRQFIEWLRDEMVPGVRQRGVFDPHRIDHYYDRGNKVTNEETQAFWRLVAFELWAQTMLN